MIIGLVAQYIKDDEKKLHIFNQTILDNMTTPSDVKLHLYSQENNLLKNYTCHTNSANLGSKVGLLKSLFRPSVPISYCSEEVMLTRISAYHRACSPPATISHHWHLASLNIAVCGFTVNVDLSCRLDCHMEAIYPVKICVTLLAQSVGIGISKTVNVDGLGWWKLPMPFVGHCQDMLCSLTLYLLACPFYLCHCCILFWFQFGSEVHHYYDLSGYSYNLYFVLIFPWFTKIFQRLHIPSCNCIVLTNRFCL